MTTFCIAFYESYLSRFFPLTGVIRKLTNYIYESRRCFAVLFPPLTGVIRAARWGEEEAYESRRYFVVLFPPYRRNKGRVRRRRGWLERRDRQSWTPVGSCQSPPDQKPNSWTYNFVEVSGYNLGSSWGFRIQCLHYCWVLPNNFFLRTTTTSNKCKILNNLKVGSWKGPVGES